MSFGKPPNPLLYLTSEEMEDYHISKIESRMKGGDGLPARCGCHWAYEAKKDKSGRPFSLRRFVQCEQHKNVETPPAKE